MQEPLPELATTAAAGMQTASSYQAELLTGDVVLWPASKVLLALVAHQHQVHIQTHAGQLTVASLSLCVAVEVCTQTQVWVWLHKG